jgi:hypothetical protein
VFPDGTTDTDMGAEGLHFVSAADSPDAQSCPLLVDGDDVSGTTRIFAIEDQ